MSQCTISHGLGWLLITLHLALVGWSGWLHTPTQDEVAHLPAGLSIWRFGRTDVYSVNPPLVRMIAAAPLLWASPEEDWTPLWQRDVARPEWGLGAAFMRANGRDGWWFMTLARWACLPFTLLGACVCWRWADESCGTTAGLISLSLWCFSPNILGYAALITPDIASIATWLLASYLLKHWLQRGGFRRALQTGLALGLALLVKSQWLVLIPLWFGFVGWLHWRHNHSRRATILQFGLLLLVAWNVLCLGYGFQGLGQRLGDFRYHSRTLGGETRELGMAAPRPLRSTALRNLPAPVPINFIRGVDLQMTDFEVGRPCYFLGQWRPQGSWAYYLVGLAIKVPLGLWGMLCVGGFVWWRGRPYTQINEHRSELMLLIVPAVCVLLIASLQTGLHAYVRYVFPLLPVGFLLAGAAWKHSRTSRSRVLLVSGLLLFILESLACFPHSMSFFNVAIGGPSQGPKYLLDANVDWGQDLRLVANWIEQHPEARPVTLTWLGFYRSADVQLPDALPPQSDDAGWHIISVHTLNKFSDDYADLQRTTLVDRIGHTHLVYHRSPKEQPTH